MNTRYHHHPDPPKGPVSRPREGRGEKYLYPIPEEPSHEAFDRDEEPGRYDVTRPGNVGDGEGA